MAYEFRLPDLGEGVQEGEITHWLVQEGERVEENQPLVEVMTDKVTAEIPSPRAGTIVSIAVPEGEVVPVGTLLVTIGEASDAPRVAAAPTAESAEHGAADELPTPGGNGEVRRVLAVPAVRRLAQDLGVHLESVPPSGPGGRITLSDVRRYAGGSVEPPDEAPSTSPEPGTASPMPGPRRMVREPSGGPTRPPGGRVPLRGLRRRIAEHMMEASQGTAPFTFVDEADLTDLVLLRDRVRPLAEERGIRLTYLPFVITAVVAALREHPVLNGTVDRATGDLVLSDACHVGMAVATPEGLVVPVIQHAERRGVLDLAREVQRLSDAARAGQLTREDIVGGTFTVSSLGERGGLMATPIINTPEVAVLAVNRIKARPVVREGQIVVGQLANLSLTFDHRYVDGADGADFTATLIRYLQDPAMMLFWLSELREEG